MKLNLWRHPPLVLACGFLLLIIAGTIVLKLPGFTLGTVSWQQAAFMATSAVTVTGLAVVDLGHFTTAGQMTIAVLIEAGGLGFMSFAVLGFMVMQKRLGVNGQMVAKEALGGVKLSEINKMTKAVFLMALIIQSMGWVGLTAAWMSDFGFKKAAYHALFYTISAFNNAGFAFTGDSLMPYVYNIPVILIISFLIIFGGLGFFVIRDVYEKWRWSAFSVNTKMVILATVIIDLVAFAAFFILEHHNLLTLGNLPLSQQLSNAWLQAVTPRTAGFNSVPTEDLTDGSTLITMLLMVIGGGSHSTAGGLKLGTVVVLMLATFTYLKQRSSVTLMKRTIPDRQVKRAIALTVVTIPLIFIGIFVLTLIEQHHRFEDVLFEVISALSTVGLSRGITDTLTPTGEAVLMFMMFAGRIGPLSLAYLIALPKASNVKYPETPIYVG